MPRPFEFDRSWRLPCSAAALWALLEQTDRYQEWWPWLERFEAEGLRPGAQAALRVRPPLPYRLAVTVAIDDLDAGRSLEATIGGDVAGPARLDIDPIDGSNCRARLSWSLELRRPFLVGAERVARPLMRWGHDRVVAAGVRQFRERALGVTCGGSGAPR